jgi:hypothetical protein
MTRLATPPQATPLQDAPQGWSALHFYQNFVERSALELAPGMGIPSRSGSPEAAEKGGAPPLARDRWKQS